MARKFEIRRSMNKDVVYGALMELSRNKQVWYESSTGPEYSHLTEEGKEAIVHVIEEMFRGLQTINKLELREESKNQVIDALKG
jgi:DNA-binding PadR family transcriptional regulator